MAEELDIVPESKPQPKVALLTFGQYFKLNHDLSIARGWQLGQDTERCMEMNPKAAKVNIQYDAEGVETGYDAMLVMDISADIQINHADLITGIELHDSYIPVDVDVQEIIATGLTSNVIDWTLLHYLRIGHKEDGMVIWLEAEARSQVSDEAVAALNSYGITIMTVA